MPGNLPNLERVREAIDRFKLLKEGEDVLVGLSGGADSVYCLLALKELGYGVRAVHVNHGLRPTADRDEEFVRGLCGDLGIPLIVRRIRVEGKGSVEERARELRYEVFRRVAKETGIGKMCLAHNLSDAYETALFNVSRGSGTFGLLIPPKSGIFVRPLILLWRDEIREALREAGFPWVEDESNYDTRFSRNFIRLEVVPRMMKLFPDLPVRFRRSYHLINMEREFLKGEVGRYHREEVLRFAGITLIRKKNPYLAMRVLSERLNVEPEKVERAVGMEGGRHYRVAGKNVVAYGNFVAVYSDLPVLEEQDRRFVWEHLNMRLVGNREGRRGRSRREGERIGGKRLKDLYDSYGIPGVLRDVHPIVERHGKVVWIPGIYGSPGSLRFVKLCGQKPYLFDVYDFVGLRLRNP